MFHKCDDLKLQINPGSGYYYYWSSTVEEARLWLVRLWREHEHRQRQTDHHTSHHINQQRRVKQVNNVTKNKKTLIIIFLFCCFYRIRRLFSPQNQIKNSETRSLLSVWVSETVLQCFWFILFSISFNRQNKQIKVFKKKTEILSQISFVDTQI